jgi:Cellulase (glycosyl hydrolase family 5)
LRAVLRVVAVAAVALALSAAAADGSLRSARVLQTKATPPLQTAVFDPTLGPAAQPPAFALMHGAGAGYVRLLVAWDQIAPKAWRLGFDPSDPNDRNYRWGALDATIEAAEGAGLTPILDVLGIPRWARTIESQVYGTPRSDDLGSFATALATRYDGKNKDGLPTVHDFMLWDEPNVSLHLNPATPASYRDMVNAFAAAVHAVDRANLVIAGGLDPFGHEKSKKQKWYSVAPLTFMRALLCVSKGAHPHSTCRDQIHFDVWSHHPYTFGGPFGKAKSPDDVELGDLPRMRAVLKAGRRLHHVVSAHPVKFWVTEFGWDTNPPREHAASPALAARWTAESLHQMWLSGVSLVTWFLIDDKPSPSPYQSGLYYHATSLENARAKPGLTAFRFPFVAYLGAKRTVSVWGRTASSEREAVTIQLRHGRSGAWRSVARISANARGIFQATLKLEAKKTDWLRAKGVDSGNSLAFSLTRPKNPKIGPWGN